MNQLKLWAHVGGVVGIVAGALGIVVGLPFPPDIPRTFLICVWVLYYAVVAVLVCGWLCIVRCRDEGECYIRCFRFCYIIWVLSGVWLLICYVI
jgi:hypothetical protein